MVEFWWHSEMRRIPCRKVRNCRVDDVLPCQWTAQGRQGLVATNISSSGYSECGCNQDPWRTWPLWSVTMVNTTNLANPTSDLHVVSAASPCCVRVKEFHFFEIQAHLAEDTSTFCDEGWTSTLSSHIWMRFAEFLLHCRQIIIRDTNLREPEGCNLADVFTHGADHEAAHCWNVFWAANIIRRCDISTWRQRSPYLEK